jgi:UDP:flavonoid glycosyltransferase YjiC (YdhE family)
LGAHLPFWHWTSEKLLAAIRKTENPELRRRVAELGEQIKKEDGLKQTIAALDEYYAAYCNNLPEWHPNKKCNFIFK